MAQEGAFSVIVETDGLFEALLQAVPGLHQLQHQHQDQGLLEYRLPDRALSQWRGPAHAARPLLPQRAAVPPR